MALIRNLSFRIGEENSTRSGKAGADTASASADCNVGGPDWFVAQIYPGKERLAQFHLQNQAFKSFCPRFRKTRRHARKAETVLLPLFPGYLFVEIDSDARWQPINHTIGVKRLLGNSAGQPQAMPLPVMEALFARCADEAVTQILEEIRPGDRVRLATGPFADQIAMVESLDDSGRVRVLLQILGSPHPVAVGRSQLDAA